MIPVPERPSEGLGTVLSGEDLVAAHAPTVGGVARIEKGGFFMTSFPKGEKAGNSAPTSGLQACNTLPLRLWMSESFVLDFSMRKIGQTPGAHDKKRRTPLGTAIGLISGNGLYPGTFARAARKAGGRKVWWPRLFHGENGSGSGRGGSMRSNGSRWGQLSRMIRFFPEGGDRASGDGGVRSPRRISSIFVRTCETLKLLHRPAGEERGVPCSVELPMKLAGEGIEIDPGNDVFWRIRLPSAGHVGRAGSKGTPT